MAEHDEHLRRLGAAFASGGDEYDRLRPGYPAEVVDRLVGDLPSGGRVLDVGAGTGLLTEALVARGYDAVAVDPSADMLAALRRRVPSVRTRLGTGEQTGEPDDSADLVTFAQSWHWVDPAAGRAELARVLRPGGTVAMVWNFVDVAVEWAAELAAAWHTLSSEEAVDATRHEPELGSRFGPVERATLTWADPMSIADLAALVTTRSYYLSASAAERDHIRAEVAVILARRFPGGGVVDVPYRTHCYRACLLS